MHLKERKMTTATVSSEKSKAQTNIPKYEFKKLNLEEIAPHQKRLRKNYNCKYFKGAVAEKGVLQPIIVQRKENNGNGNRKYVVIDGMRRCLAARKVGEKEIMALIAPPDMNLLETAVLLNMQRDDLRPIEAAEALQALLDNYNKNSKNNGGKIYNQGHLAKFIGKPRTTINELLSLNDLPDEIKDECRGSDDYSKSYLLEIRKKLEKVRKISAKSKIWEKEKKKRDTSKNGPKSRKTISNFDKGVKFSSPTNDVCLTIQRKKNETGMINKESLEAVFNDVIETFGMHYKIVFEPIKE